MELELLSHPLHSVRPNGDFVLSQIHNVVRLAEKMKPSTHFMSDAERRQDDGILVSGLSVEAKPFQLAIVIGGNVLLGKIVMVVMMTPSNASTVYVSVLGNKELIAIAARNLYSPNETTLAAWWYGLHCHVELDMLGLVVGPHDWIGRVVRVQYASNHLNEVSVVYDEGHSRDDRACHDEHFLPGVRLAHDQSRILMGSPRGLTRQRNPENETESTVLLRTYLRVLARLPPWQQDWVMWSDKQVSLRDITTQPAREPVFVRPSRV